MDFDDLEAQGRYKSFQVYSKSKLANLLFTYELARRLERTDVTANALHPGLVATNFLGNNGLRGKILKFLVGLKGISPEDGADTCVFLAAAPAVAGVSGKYFEQRREVESSAASNNQFTAERLWMVSEGMTKPVADLG